MLKEIKSRIDKIDIKQEIPKDVQVLAKDNNILIAYGGSDDLLELRGAINEEYGAWEGFDPRVMSGDGRREIEVLKKLLSIDLVMNWCPNDELSGNFTLKEGVEFEEFDIIEDEEVFCRGVIVQM